MRPIRSMLVGDTLSERKLRFLFGLGILVAVTACSAFAIRLMDDLCLTVAPNSVADGRVIGAISLARAKLIVAALATSIIAMIYSSTVARRFLIRSTRS